MRTWFFSHWDSLRGTFWFLPLWMVVGVFLLSLLTVAAVDQVAAKNGVELILLWGFVRGPDGSLATIVCSMMTIASICFSITILALQQASTLTHLHARSRYDILQIAFERRAL